ncbi:CW-type Zinc Finger [Perilla frutescens var. frutescens]|nr:CW-type Zinc Finger [Perilla frutescens var. frutescens]
MVQEPELEEGETCYHEDDASIDPDIALSYIGDKVQSILGHLQKDFEGGVCAENLGAKFGGYGSFLPTHQRSPSIWSQQKSSPRVQNSHLPGSPNACPEGPAPKSVVPSTQRDDASSSPSMRASQTLKISSHDASIGQKASLSSGEVAETFPGKVKSSSSKLSNPLDQRTLKVRIKVGPERVAQYNAQIYSLGLTSPSSSEGNSHDESDELLLENHEIPNESPAYMLKMMTSFPVFDGLLLSPLCEDLLHLTRERKYSLESKYEAAPKNSAISIKILNNDASGGKKTKAVDKRGNFDKLKDKLEDLDGCEQKTLPGDNMEWNIQSFHDLNCKSLPDRVSDSEKNVLINKRRESKNRVKGRAVSGDSVKDVSFEHTSDQSHGKYEQLESRCSPLEKIEEHRAKISQKDVSVDHEQVSKNGGKGSYPSFKAYADHSEGERVEKSMDDSTLKTGLNSTSSEHYGSDLHPVGRSSIEGGKKLKVSKSNGKTALQSDSFTDGDCAAPKKKSSGRKDVHKLHLGKKDVVHTSLEHMERPKHLLDRPFGNSPKNFNLDEVKAKPALADKLKERSNNKKHSDRVLSDSHLVEPPAAAVHSKEVIFSGLEQTVAAPVLIQEDWVSCDRCETWRLLPYGTKAQLPDKWVCSMQNWLPGLNRCDISEDQTTAAVRALSQVPVPENQQNFQAHANGFMGGAVTATAHDFNHSHQNFASDQMIKQKLKKRQSTVGTSYPLHSNTQMQLPRLDLENGSSKDVKPSLPGVNVTNQFDMQHPSKSASVLAKLNKRKGEHVIGDDSNPRKKVKESVEYIHGKGQMKRIKSKDVSVVDKVQSSCGNLGVNGDSVASGLPNKAAVKNGKKKSAKDGISGGLGNIQINVKHGNIMQDLPDNGPLGVEMCNDRQVRAKKIKLKDYAYSQHQVERQQNNGGTLQDRKVSIDEDSKVGDIHRDKKSRVSHIENDELRRSQGGDISKRSVEIRSLGAKEYPTNRSFQKEQMMKKPTASIRLTIEDIDELRKDLGYEQLSMAATSSSSKVSDTRKNRLSYVEVKGSPEESVSSSPMRMLYPNQVSPMMKDTTGKVDFRFNEVGAVSSVKKHQDMNVSSELGTARRRTSDLNMDNGSEILDSKNKSKKETAVDGNHHALVSHDFSLKSVKNSPSVGKNNIRKSKDSRSEKQSTQREHDKNGPGSSNPCGRDVMQQNLKQDRPRSSIEQNSAQMEPWSGKVRIDLRQGNKQGALRPSKHASGSMSHLKRPMDSKSRDVSVLGDTSKSLKGTTVACIKDGKENLIKNEMEQQSMALDASLRNKNVSGATVSTAKKGAEDVLKEAEELRTHADLIKNSGFGSESNYEYFKAALKFLHGASLLEACNAEPNKQMETSPMQMYGAAAQLCKICASEYEKGHELALAALAYKCMEVAYLRVVYCKSASACRCCQDLQSSLQMVPQGESPSSSASDVDNLNNLAMADKATLSKGSGSHAGNHVIVPRNRPNFVRLLDFTKDVNSAMEAAKKSQDTFAAAHVELRKSQNKDAMVSVKRVIDFSFQDVEELVRLVWLAFNTINHQGLRGDRE